MGITYHKLHRIKTHKTWSEIAEDLSQLGGAATMGKSVSRMTLHQLAECPHKQAKPNLKAAIDQLHETIFGSPFPKGVNRLIETYRWLSGQVEHAQRQQHLLNLEAFLNDHFTFYAAEDAYQARMHWLMGNVKEDLMRLARDTRASDATGDLKQERLYRNNALFHYKKAQELLEQQGHINELFKLKQNLFACYSNAIPPGERHQSTEIKKCINEIGMIETAREVLNAEPFQWLTARTALMCIALRRETIDLKFAREFFEKLVLANQHFINLEYEPLYFKAIAKDKDLQWIRAEILTTSTLKSIRAHLL